MIFKTSLLIIFKYKSNLYNIVKRDNTYFELLSWLTFIFLTTISLSYLLYKSLIGIANPEI